MRKWLYKTDDDSRPRRFLDHRELLLWAALKVGRYAGPPLGLGVISAIFAPRGLPRAALLWLVLGVLVLCAATVAGIHLYIALSGGVMSAEQREAYQQKLRESRRRRW